MSLFSTILGKIFGSDHPAVVARSSPTGAASTPTAGASMPAPSAPVAIPQVDVEKILNDMGQKNAERLNWRTSIVDLMKLLGMDSSLTARKTLAEELHYTGDTNDSATMNMWLQKQVMAKLAQNGGKVPADLLR